MTRLLRSVLLLGAATMLCRAADALPAGDGLAACYPGDEGLRSDPAVVFADDFECYEPTWEGEWPPAWDGVIPPRTQDRAHVHRGGWALELQVRPTPGTPAARPVLDSTGRPHSVPSADRHASVYTWFDAGTFRGSTGYDAVFARWYVMFAPGFTPGPLDCASGALVGARTHWRVVSYDPEEKPDGTNVYLAAALPMGVGPSDPASGRLTLTSYGPDTDSGPQSTYVGTPLLPSLQAAAEPDRWYCLEVMLRPNTPGRGDGEQALWVDGKLVGHWSGLRYRDTDSLKVNGFWLQLSAAEGSQPTTMWCDDVVIAQSYIGPMVE